MRSTAVACALGLALVAPGCARRAPTVVPVAPVVTTVPPAPAPRLVPEVAHGLIDEGRLADAAAILEGFLADAPATPERGDALELAAYLRLSTEPAVRNLDAARHWLSERLAMLPASPRQLEIGATLALLEQALALEAKLEALRVSSSAARAAAEEQQAATVRELRQARTDNTALRAEVKELQDEVKRKEDALQKLAATVVSPKPPE
jgi:hypothetical protein